MGMTLAEARAKTRALLQGVDVIIEESYRAGPDFKPKVLTGADINSFYGFGSDSTVPTPPAVTNEKVFTLDGIVGPSGAQDWFESAMVLPAKVLSDFARAAHDLRTGDGRMWFRNCTRVSSPRSRPLPCALRARRPPCAPRRRSRPSPPPPSEHGRGVRAVLPCCGRIFPRAPPPYKNNRSTRPRRPTID